MQKIKQALLDLDLLLKAGSGSVNMRDRYKDAQQELAELKPLLQDIEFVSSGEPYIACCPDCGAKEGSRHKARCRLDKFVKEKP